MHITLKATVERIVPNNGYGSDEIVPTAIRLNMESNDISTIDPLKKPNFITVGQCVLKIQEYLKHKNTLVLKPIVIHNDFKILSFIWDGWTVKKEAE